MITKLKQLTLTTSNKHHDDITNWLQLKGALAITILDAGDEPMYEPAPDAIPIWQELKISALFDLKTNIDSLINKLNYDFSSDVVTEYNSEIIEQDLTNIKYNFEPVCFSNKLWIYPYGKHPEANQQNTCYFNLEPGLAFGSGEHPTTVLCLEWLAQNLTPDTKPLVIDYGSGSGILSLAAIKLGAASAIAVDNDPQAILATTENARRNKISEQISAFMPGETPYVEADIVVANILANPLIELAPTLISSLKIGGSIVLSGILNEQADLVTLTYMNYGITVTDITKKGAWIRIVGRR